MMWNWMTQRGDADDVIFKRTNSKQGDGNTSPPLLPGLLVLSLIVLDCTALLAGVVGLLTKGALDRTQYYVHAIILALVPFINPGLY